MMEPINEAQDQNEIYLRMGLNSHQRRQDSALMVLEGFLLILILLVVLWSWPVQAKQNAQTDNFYLAFSSFHSLPLSISEVKRLKEQGYPAFYRKTAQGKAIKFQVMAGPYPNKAAATSAGEKLQDKGLLDHIRVVSLGKAAMASESRDKQRSNDDQTTAKQKTGKASTSSRVVSELNKTKAQLPNISMVPVPDKSPAVQPKAESKLILKAKPSSPTAKKPVVASKKDSIPEAKPDPSISPEPTPEVKTLPQVIIPESVPVPPMPTPPVTPAWPYFDAAVKDFQKGRYVKARSVFQDILARPEVGQPWRELAERRLVDCLYFLKESNNNEVLSELVYQYKNILFKYPDIRSGNDLAYWRVGHLYKAMALYVDAVDAFNNLLVKYPGSRLAEEGLYQMGEVLRLDKKYPEAVEALQTFYAKYPASALSRAAIFALADTYYRMGRSRDADIWYKNALQRWPDLYGLSDGVFLNVGHHFYNVGNYQRAFQIFAYFRNLYPKNRHAHSAARAMAKSLAKMGQASSAVRVLSTDLTAERDKKEVIRNRLLMAELGAGEPKAHTSLCFPGVENYREPLLSCDRMLLELKGDALTEEVLYQKARVLRTIKLNQEAFDTYAMLLRLYPKSPYQAACRQGMEETRNILVKDYYQKGDYLAVADLYFTEGGFQYHLNTDVLFKIGDSLKHLGLYAQAAKTLQDLKNTQGYPNPENLDLAIAESEIKSGNVKAGRIRLTTLLGKKRITGTAARKANQILADSFYAEENYNGAMAYYALAIPMVEDEEGTVQSLYCYADTLKRQGQDSLAKKYFRETLDSATATPNALSASMKGALQMNLAESYLAANLYDQALPLLNQSLSLLPKGADRWWALYRLTGGYLETNNLDLAEKASERIKANTDDPFWSKMADYGFNDGIWFSTYEDYLK
ncbi:MAG: tetratricopeptide repeat protein [Syntrophaceae bacterium]|nr:tetratricopeptide repeat protein [Syntrophaceae bacterium]